MHVHNGKDILAQYTAMKVEIEEQQQQTTNIESSELQQII